MKIQNLQTYDMYYDQEGDFLEIMFGEPPEKGYSEEIEPGVFVHRIEKTNKIYGVGIISFKKRAEILAKIIQKFKLNFPLKITYSN